MRIKDKLRYKLSEWSYGKKTLNTKTSKVTKTVDEIDGLLEDVVKTIKKKDEKKD
jgi:peptide deformylase